MTQSTWITAIIMFAIDSVAAVAAPPINTWYLHTQGTGAQVPLESGAALIAVTTFVGIWLIQRQRSSSDILVDMRSAIAGSFILVPSDGCVVGLLCVWQQWPAKCALFNSYHKLHSTGRSCDRFLLCHQRGELDRC